MQRITHRLANECRWVLVFVGHILAARPADHLLDRRLACRARQGEVSRSERRLVGRRHRVNCGRQVVVDRDVGIDVAHGRVRKIFRGAAKFDVVAVHGRRPVAGR